MTKFADDAATELAKKLVAEDKKVADHSRQQYAERAKGKPTPTQEENDLAAHGAHITEHDEDGSGPDPHVTKHMEGEQHHASSPARYSTRAATPARHSEN